MPSVGSSSSSRLGRPARQRASASICCSPPESARPRPLQQCAQHREVVEQLRHRALAAAHDLAHAQVVHDAELRVDVPPLRHVADAEPRAPVHGEPRDVLVLEGDAPAGGPDLPHQRAQQRGLAHAVVAEHAHDLAARDGEIDPVQDRDAAVAGVEAFDLKQGRKSPGRPRARPGWPGCAPWCPRPGCGPGGTR